MAIVVGCSSQSADDEKATVPVEVGEPRYLVTFTPLACGQQSNVEIALNDEPVTLPELSQKFAASWREFVHAWPQRANRSAAYGDHWPPLIISASDDVPTGPVLVVLQGAAMVDTFRVRLLDGNSQAGIEGEDNDRPWEFANAQARPPGTTDPQSEKIRVAARSDLGGRLSEVVVDDPQYLDVEDSSGFTIPTLQVWIARRCASVKDAGFWEPEMEIYVDERLRYADFRRIVAACVRRVDADGTVVPLRRLITAFRPLDQYRARVPSIHRKDMDPITQEIIGMLAKRKLLAVWLIDQSASLLGDREKMLVRINRIYAELGLSVASKDDAIITAVGSFGTKFVIHTPQPISNPQEALADLFTMPKESSANDSQFSAVVDAIAAFKPIAANDNRQLAIFLVTDESRDLKKNETEFENAVQVAADAECNVYVVDRECAFMHLRNLGVNASRP